jgi:hypothetical protein
MRRHNTFRSSCRRFLSLTVPNRFTKYLAMKTSRCDKRLRCHDWTQSGVVALWHYEESNRNYLGWHLTADGRGCASLCELIDAMVADGSGATRRITITAPPRAMLAVPNCPQGKPISPQTLRLSVHRSKNEWRFSSDAISAEIRLGETWLHRLRQGIVGIHQGDGDYSIGAGSKDQKLWFWW